MDLDSAKKNAEKFKSQVVVLVLSSIGIIVGLAWNSYFSQLVGKSSTLWYAVIATIFGAVIAVILYKLK